jgi:hypothetical protein
MPACSHGHEQPELAPHPWYPEVLLEDYDTCPVLCARCGHPCHWHTGQACDAGGDNACIHPGCRDKRGGCRSWSEP